MKILVLNAGSSSLKYQVLEMPEGRGIVSGTLENIGTGGLPDQESALRQVVMELGDVSGIHAVGHRVVHGASEFVEPTLLDDDVIRHIETLSALAPLHNPANLEGIRAARLAVPGVPHVAVFDTAFHHTMSEIASSVALPEDIVSKFGIKKYGFHGTSHS